MIVNPNTSTATIRKIASSGEAPRLLDGASIASGCGKVTLRYYRALSDGLPACKVPIYCKQVKGGGVYTYMKLVTAVSLLLISSGVLFAQEPNPTQTVPQANNTPGQQNPIFKVEVVSRSISSDQLSQSERFDQDRFPGHLACPESKGEG